MKYIRSFEIIKKNNKSDSLIKHALPMEAIMRHFAAGAKREIIEKGVKMLGKDIYFVIN